MEAPGVVSRIRIEPSAAHLPDTTASTAMSAQEMNPGDPEAFANGRSQMGHHLQLAENRHDSQMNHTAFGH